MSAGPSELSDYVVDMSSELDGLVGSLAQKTTEGKVVWSGKTLFNGGTVLTGESEREPTVVCTLISGAPDDWFLSIERRETGGQDHTPGMSAYESAAVLATATSVESGEVLKLAKAAQRQISQRQSAKLSHTRTLVESL